MDDATQVVKGEPRSRGSNGSGRIHPTGLTTTPDPGGDLCVGTPRHKEKYRNAVPGDEPLAGNGEMTHRQPRFPIPCTRLGT